MGARPDQDLAEGWQGMACHAVLLGTHSLSTLLDHFPCLRQVRGDQGALVDAHDDVGDEEGVRPFPPVHDRLLQRHKKKKELA